MLFTEEWIFFKKFYVLNHFFAVIITIWIIHRNYHIFGNNVFKLFLKDEIICKKKKYLLKFLFYYYQMLVDFILKPRYRLREFESELYHFGAKLYDQM
jgi:hypothetical protein